MTQRTIKKGNTKTVIAEGYEALAGFALSVPALFNGGEGETLHSGRNTVKAFTVNGSRLVVKRYKRPNIAQRVVYTLFRKTKARRAYEYAAELRRRGITTPREVAYIEQGDGGWFATGYFISSCCPDPPAFGPLVRDAEFDRKLADALASFIVEMHSKGVLHGDMNLGNFLYRRDGGGDYLFTVIDTNRSKFTDRWPTRQECIDNLKKITHRRDVLEHIVRRYAGIRGWDVDRTLAEVLARLDRFERRHDRKNALKHALKHGK